MEKVRIFNGEMMKKITKELIDRESLNSKDFDREIYLALCRNANEKIAAFKEIHSEFIDTFGTDGLGRELENIMLELEQTQIVNIFIRNGYIEVYELVLFEGDKQKVELMQKIDLYSKSAVLELVKIMDNMHQKELEVV